MKGLTVEKAGSSFSVTEDLAKPSAGPHEILVETLAVAINPVDWKQAEYGFFVDEWPGVVGTDAAAEVIEVGSKVSNFKKGDRVYGCTRLGSRTYSAFTQYHLMDAHLAIPFQKGMKVVDAAASGVASLTAGLGVFFHLNVSMLQGTKKEYPRRTGWALVNGGASGVGMFAIQFLHLAGYSVVATCSPKNNALVHTYGACATINYRDNEEKQLKDIADITHHDLSLVFDAIGDQATTTLSMKALEASYSKSDKKIATVGSADIKSEKAIPISAINLGAIGRDNETNKRIEQLITMFGKVYDNSLIKNIPTQLVGGDRGTWENVIEGLQMSKKGVSGTKLVIVLK